MAASTPSRLRALALPAVGAAVLIGAWPFWAAGPIAWLVAWGCAVVVPLGLPLTADPDRSGRLPLVFRLARWSLPAIVVGALGTWWLPVGTAAAGAAALVVIGFALIGLHGLRRLLRRGPGPAEELAIDVGLLLLPVASLWLVASRAGVSLFGFFEPVVLLTAAHFLYAGFGASLVLGLGGRALDPARRRARLFRLCVLGVCAGVPLTAVGIVLGHGPDSVAAVLVALGMLGAAFVLVGQVAPRARAASPLASLLLRSGPCLLVLSMALAVAFAITGSVARDAPWSGVLSLEQMVLAHGAVNALGFVTVSLVALVLVQPRVHVQPGGMTVSALAAWGRVGPDFFARSGALGNSRTPQGLVTDLEAYRSADFEPARAHREVRRFYEQTAHYSLIVTPRWRPVMFPGALLWRVLARLVGQLELPTSGAPSDAHVHSAIVDLQDVVDGRTGVRGWVRTYAATGRAIYVAAYACVESFGRPLMNIAFPLPLGSLTSVLRFEHVQPPGAIRLVTWSPKGEPRGDEGIYFANRLLPIRVPMSEAIEVWWDEAAAELRARHELRLLGVRYLVLDYRMHPAESEARSESPAVAG